MGAAGKAIALGIAGVGGFLFGKGRSSEPQEPQNATKQDGTPDVTHIQGTDGQGGQYDFSEVEMNTPQSTFKSTNVAYLDDKLQNGTATMMDALVAKQFLGMNLGEYGHQTLDVNMNAKMQLKKDADYLQDLANTNLMIDNAIDLSEDNLGVGGAWDRFWNKTSGKWLDLSDRGAQFQSANHNIIRQYAKAIKGGKPSNQDIKDLEAIYGLGATSESNYIERMYQMKFDVADKLQRQIETLQSQGRPVPQQAYSELKNAQESLAYLENQLQSMGKGKDFDYNGWKTYARRGNFDPRNPQNQKARQGVVERN